MNKAYHKYFILFIVSLLSWSPAFSSRANVSCYYTTRNILHVSSVRKNSPAAPLKSNIARFRHGLDESYNRVGKSYKNVSHSFCVGTGPDLPCLYKSIYARAERQKQYCIIYFTPSCPLRAPPTLS